MEVEAVAQPLHLGGADDAQAREVARVDDVHEGGMPVAREDVAVAVAAGLRLLRLDHAYVLRARGIRYVHELHAGAALADNHERAGDVDAGGLLHGFVVGEQSRRGAVADVHEPCAGAARGDGEKAAIDGHLPEAAEAAELRDGPGRHGVGNVEDVQRVARAAVERGTVDGEGEGVAPDVRDEDRSAEDGVRVRDGGCGEEHCDKRDET